MGTIRGVLRKYKALQVNIRQVVDRSFEGSKEEMADYNLQQMMKGESAKGGPIGEYQNDLYAQVKHRINPLPGFGVPDLRKTGAFHKSLYVEIAGNTVRFLDSDVKAAKLEEQYGREVIYGHNRETRVEFIRSVLRPAFMQEIKQTLKNS